MKTWRDLYSPAKVATKKGGVVIAGPLNNSMGLSGDLCIAPIELLENDNITVEICGEHEPYGHYVKQVIRNGETIYDG